MEDLSRAVALLGRLPVFAGCTTVELERLASRARLVAFHAGERLCNVGDESTEAYVVTEGQAKVTVGNVTVGLVGPADIVCERGPITNRPRAATVTARTGVVAYAIDRDDINAVIATSPAAGAAMRDEILRRYG
jgi:CRP-like cAMP-binding protein